MIETAFSLLLVLYNGKKSILIQIGFQIYLCIHNTAAKTSNSTTEVSNSAKIRHFSYE